MHKNTTNPTNVVKFQSDHEAERLNQLQYGRKKLVLPSHSHSNGKQIMNKPQTQQKPKILKVGHEACLSKVISERRRLEITLVNGTIVRGELLEFDKYSMRIRLVDDNCMWYFKGAMIGFSEIV